MSMLQCSPHFSPLLGMIKLAALRGTFNAVAYNLCRFLVPSVKHNEVLHEGSAGVPLRILTFSASPNALATPYHSRPTTVSTVASPRTSGRLSHLWMALAHSAPQSTTAGSTGPKS